MCYTTALLRRSITGHCSLVFAYLNFCPPWIGITATECKIKKKQIHYHHHHHHHHHALLLISKLSYIVQHDIP